GPGVDWHRLRAVRGDRVVRESEGDRLVAVGQGGGAGRQAVDLEVRGLHRRRVDRVGQRDDELARRAPHNDRAVGRDGTADGEGEVGREVEVDRDGAGAGAAGGGVDPQTAAGE